jgi:hypothetical protein
MEEGKFLFYGVGIMMKDIELPVLDIIHPLFVSSTDEMEI